MNNPPDVLYTCIPSYGHLDWGGVLDTLMQLKARGHKIIVGSGLNVAPFVLSQGFEFLDLELNALKCKEEGETLSELLKSHRDQNFFSVEESLAAASTLSRYLEKRNTILFTDPFFKAASIVANDLGIAYAAVIPPKRKVPSQLFDIINNEAQVFLEGVKGKIVDLWEEYPLVVKSPYLNIGYSINGFFGQAGSNEFYVGASEIPSSDSRKGIYYSTGTVFWNDLQIKAVIKAARKTEMVLATSGAIQDGKFNSTNLFERLSDEKVEMVKYVLTITQGGIGTVIKAIRSATPLIVAPIFYGNSSQASAVDCYGNGLSYVTDTPTSEDFSDLIRSIINRPGIAAKAKELQSEFNSAGGEKKAADLLVRMI